MSARTVIQLGDAYYAMRVCMYFVCKYTLRFNLCWLILFTFFTLFFILARRAYGKLLRLYTIYKYNFIQLQVCFITE